mgnify:CR=1 FL=1
MIIMRKERVTVFLGSDIVEAVKICAVKKRKRVSDVVAIALREYLSKSNCRNDEANDILESDGGKEHAEN